MASVSNYGVCGPINKGGLSDEELTHLFLVILNAKGSAAFTLFWDIVSRGIEVNSLKDAEGNTPLQLVSKNGFRDMAALLVSIPDANVNDVGECGSTPLHLAVQNGHIEIVALLLTERAKIDLTLTNQEGKTPLQLAQTLGSHAIEELLQSEEARLNKELVDLLRDRLHEKVEANILPLLKTIVSRGIKIDSITDFNGNTPLQLASAHGFKETAEFLLQNGVNVDDKGEGENEFTPLHFASLLGHKAIVQLLLTNKANTTLTDRLGNTPLMWAAAQGHHEIVQLLSPSNQ